MSFLTCVLNESNYPPTPCLPPTYTLINPPQPPDSTPKSTTTSALPCKPRSSPVAPLPSSPTAPK
ncbi:uncharacterized protein EAE97_000181 [Botrytis byssoidea]|uniref:Uncharacterized protein n=1 Tax=Botrytis byssoidea TaxID=139641 RepID=A0A9P5IXC3_9HELO|nr:uncharacterized protein EAE97_000181 [Botrytis byssoidea]KAF7954922.1 hypothetical protein EAE97_000181 [Botrytis byssoidea]